MQGSGEGKMTQALDSGTSLTKPESQEASVSLSKDLALQLLGLMKRVTDKEVTAQTVNAACNCASEIHKILRLNFEMKKRGL
jgi:hypothetical protein